MINWKVRIRNKTFWMALIPAIALLAQSAAAALGFELELTDLSTRWVAVINQLFTLLTILGIINDPTTEGLGDSERAMGYEMPQ